MPTKNISKSIILLLSVLFHACHDPQAVDEQQLDERMSGGTATVFDEGVGAFTHAIPGLSAQQAHAHDVGDKMFEVTFVPEPAPLYQGLGPIYNQVSCLRCHGNDGRGFPPLDGQANQNMVIRLSLPGTEPNGEPLGVPGFGGQLQDRANVGTRPEGRAVFQWQHSTFTLPDGEQVAMRRPIVQLTDLYASLPPNHMLSVRLPRPVFGLGLVEAISEADIMANADEYDRDGNDISGRANRVWDYVNQRQTLGRFGWKANIADLLNFTATAFKEDIGLTSYIQPQENAHGQSQMLDFPPSQRVYDLPDSVVQSIAFYLKTLAVPARRHTDQEMVKRGQALFKQIGCVGCHISQFKTRTDVSLPAVSGQYIRPYSDFLLHNMGPDLSDGRPDYLADGSEWRTPPLWGIGLTRQTNGNEYYLHDGRARSLQEAILWHGGEATRAQNAFQNLSRSDREALLRFLGSL